MPISNRSQELIQKYFETLASEAELVELEGLLAADPEVAGAFAETARLHAGLQSHFRKQYKIDQVAELLGTSDSNLASASGIPRESAGAPARRSAEPELPLSRDSAFVPVESHLIKPRRYRSWKRSDRSTRSWKWIATLALLLLLGIGFWTFKDSFGERPRIISGQVTVAGREVGRLPERETFDVGENGAVIEIPGGVRVELQKSTRAMIRRDAGRFVLQLASGSANFHVAHSTRPFDVETILGVLSTSEGRFSLDLVTTLPEQITPTERLRLPTLAVVVAEGSVRVTHAGIVTTLAAGDRHDFFSAT